MTVITMILPFLLVGNVMDRLPGVGFKTEHFTGKSSISSERMNTKTVLHTTTLTNVSVPGQSEIKTSAQVKVELSTSTSYKCVSIMEGSVLTTKTDIITVAEVLSTMATSLPGTQKELQTITRTTILISTQGRMNSTVRPTTKSRSLFNLYNDEYSMIEGSTINMKESVKQSESTFSAIVKSATEAVIDSTMMNSDDECSESKVQAKTISEYEGFTQTRAEGKTEPDVQSEKLTSTECTTVGGAQTEMYEDGSQLTNVKARTMELSSTTNNKQQFAPETKGRRTIAYGASATMFDFETSFVNVRSRDDDSKEQESALSYQSSASSHVSSHSVGDVMTSTVTGKNSSVKTMSSSSSFSQFNTEGTASGKMNTN